MEIEGVLEDIIFQNEVNSYLVGNLETDTEIITIVGYLPFVKEGDTLKVTGKYVEHKEYGKQFKVEIFEKIVPKDTASLEKYLANGNIKGIGPATAKKIIKKFGEDTINVLKGDYKKLATIKGITEKAAEEMSREFVENCEVWQIVGYLDKFGIGAENAKKVFNALGANAKDEIENNPYLLIDMVRGVNFKQIDTMAMQIGISEKSQKRVKSAIKYALLSSTVNGHSCVLKKNLVVFVQQLLGIEEEIIEDNIINLKVAKQIVLEKREEEEWVYLYNFYRVEEKIARRIKKLKQAHNELRIDNVNLEIAKVEKTTDIILSEKQKEAIEAISENNVAIITGGPGTGKTTIIKTILEIYKNKRKKVVLCAPTGRAAKRMTETTGEEAKTLHRLLEIGKINDDAMYQDDEHFGTPIDGDVIIVDEVSMADMFLMDYLLNSIYIGKKVVLVGDSDQLPSVGPGNVLQDIIKSEKVETIHLDKIFRQAAKSKIIVNAHRVNKGEKFASKEEFSEDANEDFFYINERAQEKILQQVISLCNGRLKNFGNYNFFENIQVLTPTKKGMLGTKELNKSLQEVLNPHKEGVPEKANISVTFRIGDRVMQIKNNYDMYWEKDSGNYETGTGVFNGEIGTIEDIILNDKKVKVRFDDDRLCWYEFSELEQIEHSYAITIHKSQGSEFDVVIMVLPNTAPMLLTRNLLYTGITRAKKLLIVVGADSIVDFMTQNVDSKKRNTGLEYKLREE